MAIKYSFIVLSGRRKGAIGFALKTLMVVGVREAPNWKRDPKVRIS